MQHVRKDLEQELAYVACTAEHWVCVRSKGMWQVAAHPPSPLQDRRSGTGVVDVEFGMSDALYRK
jgi:hypothetical protein